MRHFFKLFLTSAIILCCSGMVTNCYCIQNNITYNENGMAVPDEDNNGRII